MYRLANEMLSLIPRGEGPGLELPHREGLGIPHKMQLKFQPENVLAYSSSGLGYTRAKFYSVYVQGFFEAISINLAMHKPDELCWSFMLPGIQE
jgi:hypothetical protein